MKVARQLMMLLIFWVSPIHSQDITNSGIGLRPSEKSLTFPSVVPSETEVTVPQQQYEKQLLHDSVKIKQKVFELDQIVFEGNTVFSSEELSGQVSSFLHRLINLDDLEEIRRLITRFYIDQGYITSGAIFSQNFLEGRTLYLKILEGKIHRIQLKGQGKLREGYIKNRLIPDVRAPINIKKLENQFQLLLRDPLFEKLNGRLIPGSERGKAILNLEVVRSHPYQFSIISDNYRAPSVGAIALGVNSWVRNLTGQGDVLDFTFMTSTPSGGDAFQYSGNWLVPIGDFGTQFYFSFNKSNVSIIEEPLTNLNIKSNSFSVEGGMNQVLIDNLQRRLSFGAGLAFKNNETEILGQTFSFTPGLLTGKNQISAVRINQEYIERREKFVVAFRSTFSIGQDMFGATIQNNHLNPDSNFLSWLGQTRGIWNLPSLKSDLVLKGSVQISDDPLLPLERIAVGGRNTVRGYRENQLVRDNGYAASAEIHYHLASQKNSKRYFDLVPFFDYGAAWNHADSTPDKQTQGTDIQHIYSAGIGFQYRIPHFIAELFWAHRLAKNIANQHNDLQDHGIHFQARLDAF